MILKPLQVKRLRSTPILPQLTPTTGRDKSRASAQRCWRPEFEILYIQLSVKFYDYTHKQVSVQNSVSLL
jgi:hypothetical protein